MSDDTLLGRSADWYAHSGWKILPCYGITDGSKCTCGKKHDEPKDIGKHPVLAGWNTAATSDRDQVAQWWAENPDYNIATFCKPSGYFVVDVDPRSDGFESLDEFELLVGSANLPPTVEAITGVYSHNGKEVRGRHLYYRCDPGEHLVGKFKDLPGLDFKHNGYVMVAPSRHQSGVVYEWKPGHAPWEMEMAEAPEGLLNALRKRGRDGSYKGKTNLGTTDWQNVLGGLEYNGEKLDVDRFLTEGIQEGSRAVDLYAMACALANTVDVDTELGRNMVETQMIRFNAEKVNPPLPLEGPGGLLMHVRRAIEFVRANPKTAGGARSWKEVDQWEIDYAKKVTEGNFRIQVTSDPTSTSDPDDAVDYGDFSTAPGSIGSAVASAAMSGKSSREAANLVNVDTPKDQDAITEEEGGTPEKRSLTDVGNGRRLVDSYQSIIRYTPGLGWFSWSGNHWEPDIENLALRELCKQMASSIASEVVSYEEKDRTDVLKWAINAKSTSRIDAAIKNANSDHRINVRVDDWDSNPHLLGVANGVVDLKTGKLLKGRPDLHITRRSPVAYTPGLKSARWDNFLNYATNGDKEFQDYLQRAVGYTFTGLNTEDVMFLVYGKAGSGKNTFVEAFIKCLGTKQYSWPMDSSILADNAGMTSSTDLYHWAELRGKRAVWFDELPDGERIKENSVKKLTGSSEISARSPGEKPFTFESQAKMWITTNHRPVITDDAMWRRIRPIPWMNVPDKPDPSLKEFLFDPEGGLPAILSWAVEGAMKVLNSPESDGLGWCKVVYEAAEMYRKSEDRLGMFLHSEAQETEGGSIPIKSIYGIYRLWSESRGEKAMSQIRLIRMLRDRGFEVTGEGGNDELLGYTLKSRSSIAEPEIDWSVLGRFAQ
jgi:putative DNA primase/helicase